MVTDSRINSLPAAILPGRSLRGQHGFTLIEVVLSLAIFAVMGAILYGAFSLSHRAVEKTQVKFERNQRGRALDDLLGTYVRSAYPYRSSPQDPAVWFDGESDRVTFVSAYSQAMGGRGMARIRIFAEPGEAGKGVLKLEETLPVRADSEVAGMGQSQGVVLAEAVDKIRLAYLDPAGDQEKWEERWDGKERRSLPRAIRMTYEDDQGRESRWILPVMMTVLAR